MSLSQRCVVVLVGMVMVVMGGVDGMTSSGWRTNSSLAGALPSSDAKFGHGLLSQFLLEPGYINLNHGSYGAPPLSIIEVEQMWVRKMEANPDRWFRYEMYTEVDVARQVVAQYVGAKEADIVFVPNASHGVNAILRSVWSQLPKNGKILYLNLAYQMVKNTLYFLEDMYDENLLQVNVTFPTTSQAIVDLVRTALDQDGTVKLASFSHITSVPSLILPVQQLISLCHSRGVLVMIDGAHAMGQIPLNLTALNADFYISNAHKWMYTPKGSAFLWVRKDMQHLIYPTVISNEGVGATPYQIEFSWEGTADKSAYLSFPAALDFRSGFGEAAIMSYMHDLAVSGGHLLAEMWSSTLLVDDNMIGAMVNVGLPATNKTNVIHNLPELLLQQYHTWVPVFPVQGVWYVRVSAQIYNELSDFNYLGMAVLALLE